MDEQQIRFYRITAGQAEEYAVPGEGIKTYFIKLSCLRMMP